MMMKIVFVSGWLCHRMFKRFLLGAAGPAQLGALVGGEGGEYKVGQRLGEAKPWKNQGKP